MKKRNFFKIVVTIVYLVLVGLYFFFAKDKKVDECSGNLCVKLCSESDRPLEALATPEFLTNATTDVLIVVSQPCLLMKILENATVSGVGLEIFFSNFLMLLFNFSRVQNGSIFVNETFVPVNKNFCFAKLNVTELETATEESETITEESFEATTESDLDVVEETSYVPMVCDEKSTANDMDFLLYVLPCEC